MKFRYLNFFIGFMFYLNPQIQPKTDVFVSCLTTEKKNGDLFSKQRKKDDISMYNEEEKDGVPIDNKETAMVNIIVYGWHLINIICKYNLIN